LSVHHFSFSAPYYLAVLALVPLLFAYVWVVRRRRPRYAVALTNVGILHRLVAKHRKRWWGSASLILLALALSTCAAALAQPRIQRTASDRSATVVLLVDVSQSMRAHDIKPDRLIAAVTAMHAFIKRLPETDKVGLVTFSDKVQVLQTPTTNHAAVDALLDVLSPQGGTALGSGVEAAVRLVVSSLAADGVRHTPGTYVPAAIVLESDGAQNRGIISPASAGELARKAGVRIYGIALGKPHGFIIQGSGFFAYKVPTPPDPGAVGLLARESGGMSFTAINTPKLKRIYIDLGMSVGRRSELTEITSWFELVAAVLLVGGIGVERARGAALP
jgi:Ca-activated chloride channel family protein